MPCIAKSGIQKNQRTPENPGPPDSGSEPGDDELRHSLFGGRKVPKGGYMKSALADFIELFRLHV
jgi:hypothetical protein